MANNLWVGKQASRPQVDTLTVGSNTAGETFVATVNGKSVTYTATASDTTTDLVATNFAAALAASTEGEFQELTFTASGSTVLVTGPSDGAPFTMTESGTGTLSISTTTAPLSPHDVNDVANWSLGSLPTATDPAIFENSEVSALYNLSALTAVAFAVTRRTTFTGRIGLPDTNAQFGYREYRAKHLETAGTSISIEQSPGDDAGQVRIRGTAAGATTANVTGPGGSGTPGSEPVELYGFAGASVVNVANAGVAVGPNTGQTTVVGTIRGVNSTIRVGPSVTPTTISLTNCEALILATYTTLTLDRGGTVEVGSSAAGTTTEVEEGTILWKSTGNFGTLTVGSDGVFDLSQAPSAITPSAALTVNEGGTLLDPAERLAKTWSLNLTRGQLDNVTLDLGTHMQLDVKAHP